MLEQAERSLEHTPADFPKAIDRVSPSGGQGCFGGWLVNETTTEGEMRSMGMSADAIADVVTTYA